MIVITLNFSRTYHGKYIFEQDNENFNTGVLRARRLILFITRQSQLEAKDYRIDMIYIPQ